MPYQQYADAFEALGEPTRRISALYEQTLHEMEEAVTPGTNGAGTVEVDALRRALDITPNGSALRLDRVLGRLDLGFATVRDQRIAPWSAFLDAQAVKPLDAGTWAFFGLGPSAGRRAEPFAAFDNVPAEVRERDNLAMLREVAAGARTVEQLAAAAALDVLVMPSMSTIMYDPSLQSRTVIPAATDTTSSVGHSSQALSINDFKDGVNCLVNGKWSITGWGFVATCCLDRACCDAVETMLSLGTTTLFGGALALLTQGLTAAVAAVGGWIALGILLGAFHWWWSIHFNKTPRGVCINIPLPWSLGIVGPGWAVGR